MRILEEILLHNSYDIMPIKEIKTFTGQHLPRPSSGVVENIMLTSLGGQKKYIYGIWSC